MKKTILMLSAAALVMCSCALQQPSPHELPMDEKVNMERARSLLASGRSPAEAVSTLIAEGKDAEDSRRYGKAIERYNQAWKIDPNHKDIYFRFASVMHARGFLSRTIAMTEKGLELDPENALATCQLARAYQDKAVALLASRDSRFRGEAAEIFKKADALYEKASGMTDKDSELDLIYYAWAIERAIQRDPKGAWAKIALSRKHGGKAIQPEFLSRLSKTMLETAG